MSQRTPGKRARRGGEEDYLAFNADPKMVGTRTNTTMPTNVPRLSDGFEDPAAFFNSPTQTEIGSRSIISTMYGGQTPKTPGGRSDYTVNTPRTGETNTSIGTLRRQKSRLSDLADQDDDDEERLDDLLVDEDDLQPATPGQRYFPESNPPSVTLPSRSRVSASSPAINRSFDSLPSPRASTAAARSPRKSNLSSYSRVTPGKSTRGRISDITDQNGSSPYDQTNDSFGNMTTQNSSPLRNNTRSKSKRLSESPITNKKTPSTVNKKNGRSSRVPDSQPDLEEEEPIDEEMSFEEEPTEGDLTAENSRRRKSTKSNTTNRKSIATTNGDREGSISENDNGTTFDQGYDNNNEEGYDETVQDISLGNDTNDITNDGGDISALVDDMAHGDEPQGYNNDNGDLSLEEIPEENENEEEEEEEEERNIQKEKKKKVKATKPRKPLQPKRRDENVQHIQRRGVREGSVAVKPKKTRVSQIGVENGSEEDEDGYHGNFQTRRSKRHHFKPLAYWKGEKFEYERGPGLSVIKEVITFPEEPAQPLSHIGRNRSTTRGRSTSVKAKRTKVRQDSYDDDDVEDDGEGRHKEDGWDAQTEPTGLVKTYPGGWESHRKIACPKAQLAIPDPEKWKNQSFHYQKVFGEGDFMAAGVVFIPIGSKKAPKPSKDNAYVFYVIQGAVQVTIYRTSFVMAPGGQFLVPRGNDYCIENISPDREVQLFFAQARKIRADEEEMVDQPPPGYIGETNGAAKRSSSVISNSTTGITKKKKRLENVREGESGSENNDDY